ncbi:MAG: HRDC domain-containing protein [Alphaproteobacteria bacterium]|nr:HRDC domain-containing protein [Alphaproteobacteria bacterium]
MNFITSTKHLAQEIQSILDICPAYVSVDTEFLRQSSYYPKVGLVQIGHPSGVLVIDALSCDLEPLQALLYQPKILKVFHSGRQDIEIFFNHFNEVPQPVADLQIYARHMGIGQQVSLNDLVATFLQETTTAFNSYSDWLKRPLRPDMLIYAYNDGRYIYDLYPILEQKIQEDEQAAIKVQSDINDLLQWPYTLRDPQAVLKKASHDFKDEQHIEQFQRLVLWREEKAKAYDKPRLHIIHDKTLCALIRQMPMTMKQFKTLLYQMDPQSYALRKQELRVELYQLF